MVFTPLNGRGELSPCEWPMCVPATQCRLLLLHVGCSRHASGLACPQRCVCRSKSWALGATHFRGLDDEFGGFSSKHAVAVGRLAERFMFFFPWSRVLSLLSLFLSLSPSPLLLAFSKSRLSAHNFDAKYSPHVQRCWLNLAFRLRRQRKTTVVVAVVVTRCFVKLGISRPASPAGVGRIVTKMSRHAKDTCGPMSR